MLRSRRQHGHGNAADDRIDAPAPGLWQQARQKAGIAGDDIGLRQRAPQIVGHLRVELEHQQAIGGDAGGQQLARDDAGAAADLDGQAALAVGELRRDQAPQRRRRRNRRRQLQRMNEGAAEEKPAAGGRAFDAGDGFG